MAIALGVHTKFNLATAANGTSGSLTTTTGSTLYAAWADPNLTGAITDSKGNTYTRIGTAQLGGNSTLNLFRCENATGGSGHTCTLTFTVGTGDCAVYFGEITGAAAASFDVTAQTADLTGTPYTITSPTLSQAAELVLCVITGDDGDPGSFSENTGMTIADSETNAALYWTSALATKVVAATTAYASSWTTGNSLGGRQPALIIATFEEDAGGGGSVPPRNLLTLAVG